MLRRFRRTVLVLTVVGLFATAAVGASAPGASAYGKANWQAALTGTFNVPATGVSEGFWGWCDFAGGVLSGTNADCQLAEYFHPPAGSGWTCQLSIDGGWYQQDTGNGNTFHISGDAVVHGHLSQVERDECVGFFVTGDPTVNYQGTSFTGVDTFIPAAAGHYDLGFLVPFFFPGAVGEFNFTVKQIP